MTHASKYVTFDMLEMQVHCILADIVSQQLDHVWHPLRNDGRLISALPARFHQTLQEHQVDSKNQSHDLEKESPKIRTTELWLFWRDAFHSLKEWEKCTLHTGIPVFFLYKWCHICECAKYEKNSNIFL